MYLYIILAVTVIAYILLARKKGSKRQDIISVYFGVPGSGKTTFAAYLSKKDLKRKQKVWSNVPITGTYKLDCYQDLGKYLIYDGRVIIDESSVEYNNRKFKCMPSEVIELLKYHRHYKLAMDFFSQSHDDMDITIRRLAQRLYVVRKSLLPWFIVRRTIRKRVGIDENTHQIIDEYSWQPFSRKYIFSPSLWKLFNTLSHKDLPEKEWETW